MLGIDIENKNVLQYWMTSADAFVVAPQEFYATVEKKVGECQIPGLEISRQEFLEDGLLSAKRVYLRMVRKKMAFDICASPFGNRYFFSCRTVYLPGRFKFWHFCCMWVGLSLLFAFLLWLLDTPSFAAAAEIGIVVILAFSFRNAISDILSEIDDALRKNRWIGPFYERIRRPSYYKEDSELMFLDTIPNIVKTLTEEASAAKGVKLVRQYERAPILGELYRPPQGGLFSATSPESQSK